MFRALAGAAVLVVVVACSHRSLETPERAQPGFASRGTARATSFCPTVLAGVLCVAHDTTLAAPESV